METTSIGDQDVLFAVETVLGASTQAAEPVGVLEFDDEVVFDGTENLLPSTSGARPPKAPKLSGRGKSKKKAAAEVEESPRKYSSVGILGGGKRMPGAAKSAAAATTATGR